MHGAREFRLVLCANASDRMVKYATEMLENLGEAERARGLDYLLCESSIIDHHRDMVTPFSCHG